MSASSDIGRYGVDDRGRALYYVKWNQGMYGPDLLRLVAIDDFGNVEPTPAYAAYDEAAMSREEAIVYHLEQSGGVAQAEADLERRRKAMPEPEQPAPERVDPATARFFSNDTW